MTLYGNYFLKSISQNPFRILGVTSNVPKKEITANVNKFKAFIRVGKHIESDFDLIKGTNQVIRTVETIETAEKAIELPIDRLRWSLFWFINNGPIDQIALNHIKSGDTLKGIEILQRFSSDSSRLNLLTAYFLVNRWMDIALISDKIFKENASSLCSLISDNLTLSSDEICELFFKSICAENYELLKKIYRAVPSYTILDGHDEIHCIYRTAAPEEHPHPEHFKLPFVEVSIHGGCSSYYYFRADYILTEAEFERQKGDLIFMNNADGFNYESFCIYHKNECQLPSISWYNTVLKVLSAPHLEYIKKTLRQYHFIDKNNISERYDYVRNTLVPSLCRGIPYIDIYSSEYDSLTNEVVKEALQSAIDYYNSIDDTDDIVVEVKEFVWQLRMTTRQPVATTMPREL